jgi:hypothetical protein
MKYSIFFIIIIVVNIVVWFYINSLRPKEIVKTVTETKEVIKYVYKEDNTQIDRVIRKKYRNGTSVVTVERVRDKSNMVSESEEDKKISVSEHINTPSPSYIVEAQIPILTEFPDYKHMQFIFGARIGNFPIFLTVGTNTYVNKFTLGSIIEF